jgi:hypothetical protein
MAMLGSGQRSALLVRQPLVQQGHTAIDVQGGTHPFE